MLGLKLGIKFNGGSSSGAGLSQYVKNFIARVESDSGIVESSSCINSKLNLTSNPIITLLGTNPTLSDLNQTYNDLGATAFDNVIYGDISYEIRATSNVDINKSGSYEVKYNLTDPSGTIASEVIRVVYITSDLANNYRDRVVADGGTIESLQCVDSLNFSQYNWSYYFRVVDDSGVVESLECVNNIN